MIVVLYLLVNVGLLRVLPLHVLGASNLPAAEAARIILPRGGLELVTVISILVVLSLLNTNLLMAPRVLFSIGRDGLFTEKAAVVSKGGTPRWALALTSVFAMIIILSGSFCTYGPGSSMRAIPKVFPSPGDCAENTMRRPSADHSG